MQTGQPGSELDSLRHTTRDLVALTTLPAIWGKLPAERVVESLADVFLRTLDLDLVLVRLLASAGAAACDIARTRAPATDALYLPVARAALESEAAPHAHLIDGQPFRTCVFRFGIGGDIGALVAGSRRPDFPTRNECMLLSVGVNQATVVLQRQLAERVLKQSQSQFLDFADTAPSMLWVTEPNGSCSFLSRGWHAFTGQSKEAGLGLGWTAMIHPADREGARQAFIEANARREEFSLEHRIRHIEGGYRWVIDTGRPRFSTEGDFLGFVGNVLDINDRKQTEQMLFEARETLAAVFEALPVGVAVADQAGKVLLSNKEMQQYLPTTILPSRDDARHARWRAFDADGSPCSPQDFPGARALRGERVVPGIEALYAGDDGTQTWTQVAAVPLAASDGSPNGQVSVVMNIDAFKRTEAALRLAEANQRAMFDDVAKSNRNLSEFLAVLAHELRNPLAPILTGLEIMRMRADNAETIGNVRGVIERQVKQLSHLINDLLDIARVTNGKVDIKKTLVDLKSIVSNAVETSLPLIEKGHHEFSLKLHDAPLPVNADPARIAQVVGNLLTNAAKYTPHGGNIKLTVGQDGEAAVIAVTDSGIGIPAESLESVFDMFSQVGRNMDHAQGGLGIGLSLVRQLVSLHEGSVQALSPGPGQGSTFVVRLPLARGGIAADGGAASANTMARATKTFRILVADDNVDAAMTLASLLGLHGHELRIAHDGRQALALAEQFCPQVVFLDIGMPGMTGYEVAQQLRTRQALAPCTIVAVSGWGAKDDLARAKAAGFDMHFTKPVAPAHLSDFLNSLA
jgi:PAS domain S-box-containing protein